MLSPLTYTRADDAEVVELLNNAIPLLYSGFIDALQSYVTLLALPAPDDPTTHALYIVVEGDSSMWFPPVTVYVTPPLRELEITNGQQERIRAADQRAISYRVVDDLEQQQTLAQWMQRGDFVFTVRYRTAEQQKTAVVQITHAQKILAPNLDHDEIGNHAFVHKVLQHLSFEPFARDWMLGQDDDDQDDEQQAREHLVVRVFNIPDRTWVFGVGGLHRYLPVPYIAAASGAGVARQERVFILSTQQYFRVEQHARAADDHVVVTLVYPEYAGSVIVAEPRYRITVSLDGLVIAPQPTPPTVPTTS